MLIQRCGMVISHMPNLSLGMPPRHSMWMDIRRRRLASKQQPWHGPRNLRLPSCSPQAGKPLIPADRERKYRRRETRNTDGQRQPPTANVTAALAIRTFARLIRVSSDPSFSASQARDLPTVVVHGSKKKGIVGLVPVALGLSLSETDDARARPIATAGVHPGHAAAITIQCLMVMVLERRSVWTGFSFAPGIWQRGFSPQSPKAMAIKMPGLAVVFSHDHPFGSGSEPGTKPPAASPAICLDCAH